MDWKKWGTPVLCVVIIAGALLAITFGGNTQTKEAETKQTELREEEKKTAKIIRKNDKEGEYYSNDEVVRGYPEFEQMMEALFEKYPDVLVKEAKETSHKKMPIGFLYSGGGGETPCMNVWVYFKDTVTLKQMTEACDYIIKELQNLFPEEQRAKNPMILEAMATPGYTKDGYRSERMSRTAIVATIEENSNEVKWTMSKEVSANYVPFNPEDIGEDEMPVIIGQGAKIDYSETPETSSNPETAEEGIYTAIPGLKLSDIQEGLKDADVEEKSMEEMNGGYISAAFDPTGTYGYTAFLDKDKQGVLGVMYVINKSGDLTQEQMIELAGMYLQTGAVLTCGEDAWEATDFVGDNIRKIIEVGYSKVETVGDFTLTLSYQDNQASLTIMHPKK